MGLQDTTCENAKKADKPYKLRDGKGLYLEVKPNGVKAWRFRFELRGKESVFAIGNYHSVRADRRRRRTHAAEAPEEAQARRNAGQLTLAEARSERDKARLLVKQGINPAHQRQLDRIKRDQVAATTFEVVAQEWLLTKDWAPVTRERRLDMLKRVVFPTIGKLPIRQVMPAHVLTILKSTASGAPTIAAEALRAMSGIFDLAIATLRADSNPVTPVRKALPPNKTQHKRALSTEEIGQLMRDLADYKGQFQTVAAFKLMWLTLCRPNEVLGAKWLEIDLERAIWRIDPKRMKGRRAHNVPLASQAVTILQAMRGITGDKEHVFPHRDDRTKPMTDNALRVGLRTMGWSGRYSPHATRTTGSTRLNEMGFASDWIERQLAHVEANQVRRTYNHADHYADRAKMMQRWADMLDGWRDTSTVVPMLVAA